MSDGVLVIDFEGHITYMNPSALDLLGFRPSETLDKTYAQLFLEIPENDAFNDILFDGIQNRETRLYKEAIFVRKDGERIDLAVTTSFLRSEAENDDEAGVVVVFKDITEIKSLDRARQRVLDHLSHELRTPLSIIAASIKKWSKGTGDEKVLARIKRNLKRLQEIQVEVEDIVKKTDFKEKPALLPYLEIVRDLVELMAEESPGIEEALRSIGPKLEDFFAENPSRLLPVSLAYHLRRVADLAEQRSTHRNVLILTDVAEDHVIRIDPDALEKVLMGLVKNAIENTPDGGEVLISMQRLPGSIQVDVTDTGIGITPESQKQIFGGFYHAKETDLYSTKRPFDFGAGGKGLDLLRCRVFGEIYHFEVQCVSRRCSHIPDENDTCPGAIIRCPYVGSREECALRGGTKFRLLFPD